MRSTSNGAHEVLFPHLSITAAGFGTLYKQVAGFHRAVPSTTLDKACMQFNTVFYTIF